MGYIKSVIDEQIDKIKKAILIKLSSFLGIAIIIVLLILSLFFSILSLLNIDNIELTIDKTKLTLDSKELLLEDQKNEFMDKEQKKMDKLENLDSSIKNLSNIIETSKFICRSLEIVIKNAKEAITITVAQSIREAILISIKANEFSLKILENKYQKINESYYSDYRYQVPKLDKVDWKKIIAISSILDTKDLEVRALENPDSVNYDEETEGINYNPDMVDVVLENYFKRLDYESVEAVRYTRSDYLKYSEIPTPLDYRTPFLRYREKVLWKYMRTYNVKVIAKTTDELIRDFELNGTEIERLMGSLSIEVRYENGELIVDNLKYDLDYTEDENGNTIVDTSSFYKKDENGELIIDKKALGVDNLTRGTEDEYEIIYKIDKEKTKDILEGLLKENLRYNPNKTIKEAINFKENEEIENPLDPLVLNYSERKKRLNKNIYNLVDLENYDEGNFFKHLVNSLEKRVDGEIYNSEMRISNNRKAILSNISRKLHKSINSKEELRKSFIEIWDEYYTVEFSNIESNIFNIMEYDEFTSTWDQEKNSIYQELYEYLENKKHWIYPSKSITYTQSDKKPEDLKTTIENSTGSGIDLNMFNPEDLVFNTYSEEMQKNIDFLLNVKGSVNESAKNIEENLDNMMYEIEEIQDRYDISKYTDLPEDKKNASIKLISYFNDELGEFSNKRLEQIERVLEMGKTDYEKYKEVYNKGLDGLGEEFYDYMEKNAKSPQIYDDITDIYTTVNKSRKLNWKNGVYEDYNNIFDKIVNYNNSISGGIDVIELISKGGFINIEKGYYGLSNYVIRNLKDSDIKYLSNSEILNSSDEEYAKKMEQQPLLEKDEFYNTVSTYLQEATDISEKDIKKVTNGVTQTLNSLVPPEEEKTINMVMPTRNYTSYTNTEITISIYKESSIINQAKDVVKENLIMARDYALKIPKEIGEDIVKYKEEITKLDPTEKEIEKIEKGQNIVEKLYNETKESTINIVENLQNVPNEARNILKLASDKENLEVGKNVLSLTKDEANKLLDIKKENGKGILNLKINNFDSKTFSKNFKSDREDFKSFLSQGLSDFSNHITDSLSKRYGSEYIEFYQKYSLTQVNFIQNPKSWDNFKNYLLAIESIENLPTPDELKERLEQDLDMAKRILNGEVTTEDKEFLRKKLIDETKNYVVKEYFGKWCEEHEFPMEHIRNLFDISNTDGIEIALFNIMSDPEAVESIVTYIGGEETTFNFLNSEYNIGTTIGGTATLVKALTEDPKYTKNDLRSIELTKEILNMNRNYEIIKEDGIHKNMKFHLKGSNNIDLINYIAEKNGLNLKIKSGKDVLDLGSVQSGLITYDDLQYLEIGDLGISKNPYRSDDYIIGIFSGEFNSLQEPLFYYFNYPESPKYEYYSYDIQVASDLKKDTNFNVPLNIVELKKEEEKTTFNKNQVYGLGRKYITDSLLNNVEKELNSWLEGNLTSSLKVKNGNEIIETVSWEDDMDRVSRLDSFLGNRISDLKNNMRNYKKEMDGKAELLRYYNRLETLSGYMQEEKNQLLKEIESYYQQYLTIDSNIVYVQALREENKKYNVVTDIINNADQFYNKDYSIQLNSENEFLTEKEIEEKESEILEEMVKFKMQESGEWEEIDLSKYDSMTREDFLSDLEKGKLVKDVGDFSMFIRLFNQEVRKENQN